jgi:hypothetical protein
VEGERRSTHAGGQSLTMSRDTCHSLDPGDRRF